MLRIELIIDARAELGEGPLWDVAEQRLYWIDSLGAKVHSCDAQGGAQRSWSVPEHIGSLALREKGGAIVSLRDGFYALDFANGACRKLADPDPGKPRVRMNDGKVDRQGRFVAGYMDYEERDPICGAVPSRPERKRRKARRRHRLLQRAVLEPGRPYLLLRRHLHARNLGLRLRHGNWRGDQPPRLLFLSCRGLKGLPDGATVDAEGFVWSVSVYEGKLARFAPNGRLEASLGFRSKARPASASADPISTSLM